MSNEMAWIKILKVFFKLYEEVKDYIAKNTCTNTNIGLKLMHFSSSDKLIIYKLRAYLIHLLASGRRELKSPRTIGTVSKDYKAAPVIVTCVYKRIFVFV